MQSHQNKFHAMTLRHWTSRFTSSTDVSLLTEEERKVWAYFASLYKNSNKGIKGRGKDRKISCTSESTPRPSEEPDLKILPPMGSNEESSEGDEGEEEEDHHHGYHYDQSSYEARYYMKQD
jgi:hypothetical protein